MFHVERQVLESEVLEARLRGRRPVHLLERKCAGAGTPPRPVLLRATSTRSAAARAGLQREIDSQAGWIERRAVVGMAPPAITIRWSTDETRAEPRPASASARVCGFPSRRSRARRWDFHSRLRGRRPVHLLERKCAGAGTPPRPVLLRATSTRSAAARAGLQREIDSQAGWIERRAVVGMAPPAITIRWSTDETRAEPRPASASARVCGFPSRRSRARRWDFHSSHQALRLRHRTKDPRSKTSEARPRQRAAQRRGLGPERR